MLIVIRGGLQPIPINMSDAYFSNNNTLNDIAVNQNWNFFQSILKNRTNLKGNPYKKFSEEDVEYFKDKFEDTSNSKLEILDNKNPNIVLIILESWSSDCIKSLEGLAGITPNFDTLVDHGYLFTDFYSNGFKIRGNNQKINGGADAMIYWAIAEHPFVTSGGVPAPAR